MYAAVSQTAHLDESLRRGWVWIFIWPKPACDNRLCRYLIQGSCHSLVQVMESEQPGRAGGAASSVEQGQEIEHAIASGNVRTYICTYVRTYVCTCVRSYVRTCIRTCICTYVRVYARTYVRKYRRTDIRTYDWSLESMCGAIGRIVREKDLATFSVKDARYELARACGLPECSLDSRRAEINELFKLEMQAVCREGSAGAERGPAIGVAGGEQAQGTGNVEQQGEDIGVENFQAARKTYLVTFPHPKQDAAANGMKLKAPSSYTKRQITEAMLDAVEKTQGPRLAPLRLLRSSVFRERHEGGDPHDHMAMLGSKCFRFQPLKLVLLKDYGLASHWSCSHEGYATCFAYCYMPSPRKPRLQSAVLISERVTLTS